LQRIFVFESDWYWPTPLWEPEFFERRAKERKWDEAKLKDYGRSLDRLREIADRCGGSTNAGEAEMGRIAREVIARWGEKRPEAVR
jgi:hypothetical protein